MGEIKQAVMIASAGGKQLGQLTRDRPKAMLPVLGKPIFIRILDQMHQAGIRHFIVVMGEQEGAVASYLNMHWLPDVQVQIVLQPFPRGAADALACASSYVTGPFLLASSENLVPPAHVASLIQRQQETDADLVLSIVPTPEDADSRAEAMPLVKIDGGRVSAIGVDGDSSAARNGEIASSFLMYACGQRLLNHLGSTARAQSDLTPAIQELIATGGNVTALKADWQLHLGREIDLLNINKHFLGQDRDTHILSELPASVRVMAPVRIDPQVSIGPNARIGPNVYVESGAHVGQDAVISNALILANADIPNGDDVHNQIVGRRMRIADDIPDANKTRPSRPQDWDVRLQKGNKG